MPNEIFWPSPIYLRICRPLPTNSRHFFLQKMRNILKRMHKQSSDEKKSSNLEWNKIIYFKLKNYFCIRFWPWRIIWNRKMYLFRRDLGIRYLGNQIFFCSDAWGRKIEYKTNRKFVCVVLQSKKMHLFFHSIYRSFEDGMCLVKIARKLERWMK